MVMTFFRLVGILSLLHAAVVHASFPSSFSLENIYKAVYNEEEGIIEFNVGAVLPSGVPEFVEKIIGSIDTSMVNAVCEPNFSASPKFFECTANFDLFSAEAAVKIIVLQLEEGDIALGLDTQLEYGFSAEIAEHLMQFHSEEFWLSGAVLDGEVGATIRAGSDNLRYENGRLERKLYIQAQGSLSHEASLLEIERTFIPSLEDAQLELEVLLPFEEESYAIDLGRSKVDLDLKIEALELIDTFTLQNLEFRTRIKKLKDVYVDIDFRSEMQWTPAYNTPGVFYLEAGWNSRRNDLELEGGLAQDWKGPAGLEWLSIDKSSQVKLRVYDGEVTFFQVKGGAEFSFGKGPGFESEIVVQATENFDNLFFATTVEIEANGGRQVIGDILSKSTAIAEENTDTSALNDVEFSSGEIHLAVATSMHRYEGVIYKKGITIDSEVQLFQESELDQRVKAFYQSSEADELLFEFDIYIPLFHVDNLNFELRAPEWQVLPHVVFDGISFKVSLGLPITVGISTSVPVEFDGQPDPIRFSLQGTISNSLQVQLSGAMDGSWNDAFNLPGLDINAAWVELGIVPVPPFLGVFGIGAEVLFGQTLVELNGYIDIVPPAGVYLSAQVEQVRFIDVVDTYNTIQVAQARRHGRSLASVELMNRDDFPEFLHINNLEFSLAPRDHVIEIDEVQVPFKQGLTLDGDIELLGIRTCVFELRTYVDRFGPNFIANVDINLPTLYQKWLAFSKILFPKKELQQPVEMDIDEHDEWSIDEFIRAISENIPQIVNLSIDDFNFRELASGQSSARFSVDIMFKQETHTFGIGLGYEQLEEDLSDVVRLEIPWKETFGIPECMINDHCPGDQVCFHKNDDDRDLTCVDDCGKLGHIPLYGCSPCISSIECIGSDSGECCNQGECGAGKGQYCGSCIWGNECNTPESGCIFGFCTTCLTNLDCGWNGRQCIDFKCQ